MLVTSSPNAANTFAHSINPEIISSSQPQENLDKKKKKKKKRAREDDQADAKKKKKRKHNDNDNIDPALMTEGIQSEAPTNVDPSQIDAPLKKSKKRKGKGKEQATPLAQQTDAEIEANSQASAAALLSAIVASMSQPQGLAQMQPPIPYNPLMQPPPGYLQFPPMPFGFPLHPEGGPHPVFGHPPVMAPPNGVPLAGLPFGSNEDVIRALQELDMSKIANALKTLGDASGGTVPTFPPQMPFIQAPSQPQPHLEGPSTEPRPLAPRKAVSSTGHKRTINMNLPGNEQHSNPLHAHILANKWMNASKLAELVKLQGLVYKKGKFSAIEEQQLHSAIEKYRIDRQMNEEQLLELIFPSDDKNKDTLFWSEITAAVPLRPIIAVYHHVRRGYHKFGRKGNWSPEEDEKLIQAVTDLGQQWEKVSVRVERMSSDCRDRYRNHIVNRHIRVTGVWSQDEEDRLIQIVTDMTINQGKDIDNDVFWGKVSELMGGGRGRQQCRIKWTDSLSKTIKNEGQKPRWSQQDAYILVHKIDSLNVRDDTEIDWKMLSDPDWNLWSAHTLQRRWLTLKKSVKGHEDMTHQEIMDILRIKKAHLPAPPPPSTRKRKERKVTSAAAVTEPDVRESNETTPEAGPSNGPGTLSSKVTQEQAQAVDDDSDIYASS